LTPLILFSETLIFSKKSEKKNLKENKEVDGIFEKISSVEMKISKIN
jgi:hypothetical protein